MTQLTMSGDDWLSDRDRARDKAAKALHAAAEALDDWMRACCNVHPDKMGLADQRRRLSVDCRELTSYIDGVHR